MGLVEQPDLWHWDPRAQRGSLSLKQKNTYDQAVAEKKKETRLFKAENGDLLLVSSFRHPQPDLMDPH